MANIEINKNQIGLTLGSVFAILHAAWVVIVGIGLGQSLADWLHSVHFLSDSVAITGFSLGAALIGIITAFISGYVLGWLFAVLWNWFGKKLK